MERTPFLRRRSARQHRLLNVAGHVGRRLHIRRDDHRHANVSRHPRHLRSAGQDLQAARHAHRGDMDERHASARLQTAQTGYVLTESSRPDPPSNRIPHTPGFYRPRKLGHSFPRLYDIVEGEMIASMFLQLNPDNRIGAEDALSHPYFAPLPPKLFELPDGECVNFAAIVFFLRVFEPNFVCVAQRHRSSPSRGCTCIRNRIARPNEN